MIEEIKYNDEILAIIIRHDFSKEGISFLTPHHFSQQLAFMKHPKGKVIQPHVHNKIKREVDYTQEVLSIRKGRLRIDFYDDSKKYLESRILSEGDVVLLSAGGHGFVALDDLEMYEVKQGPYSGDFDKIRFAGISDSELKIK
jgi:mannose-6-phosphate isomerase-like protein (cupin superfamily)